jgi:hypothetical protein
MTHAGQSALYLREHDHNAFDDDWPDIERRITMSLNSLVRIISLPSEMAVRQVGQFALSYCDYRQRVFSNCHDHDSHTLRVLINRTVNHHELFSSQAPVDQHRYMPELQRAYFVLRALEEANDRYQRNHHKPLTSHDLSTANLIIYCLLGEHQAAAIDSLVFATLSGWMPGAETLPAATVQDSSLVRICQSWPCLAASLGLPSLLLVD